MCKYKKDVILDESNKIDSKLSKSDLKAFKYLLKAFKKRHNWNIKIKE